MSNIPSTTSNRTATISPTPTATSTATSTSQTQTTQATQKTQDKDTLDTTKKATTALIKAADKGKEIAELKGNFSKAKDLSTLGKVGQLGKTVASGAEAASDIGQAIESGKAEDIVKATSSSAGTVKDGLDAAARFSDNPALKTGKYAAGAIADGAKLPDKIGTAAQDVKKAIQSGTGEDIAQAAVSTTDAAKTGISAGDAAINVASRVHQNRATLKGAAEAASKTGVADDVANAAAKAATKATKNGASRQVTRAAARQAATQAARKTVGRSAARAAGNVAGNAAATGARTAAKRAAAGGLAKAAGRFAPGVNIAIAAYDGAKAVQIISDPKASTGKKVAAGLTAAASAVSATNIPVVSQIGAGVATITGFFRDW